MSHKKIWEEIYLLAQNKMPTEEYTGDYFNVYDECGGNYDDAFQLGIKEGKIQLARTFFEIYKES